MQKSKTGILLINVGTPDAPTPQAVGKYLREFLMDPDVINIAWPLRWLLVQLAIVPKRKHASAELYRKVWTERGSPLLRYHLALAEALSKELGPDFVVVPGMRYGKPSIREGLKKLAGEDISKIIVAPLYPQYSTAATESALRCVKREASRLGLKTPIAFLEEFYRREEFLASFEELIGETMRSEPFDHLVFSFHGLPEDQVKSLDPTGLHCRADSNCCDKLVESRNSRCYRAQSYQTAHALARRLGLAPEKYSVAFQSRLGNRPWIKPFTDELYVELPQRGIKRIAVASPSFVADCLETLEEIAIRGNEAFQKAGGTRLKLVPSLNDHPSWVKGLARILSERAVQS